MAIIRKRETPAERILRLSTVNEETGCWIWDSVICNSGYGKIKRFGKMERAHRASYTEFIGDIPEGMYVCHTCDVPTCVNPDHLYLGTPRDNMEDMVSKGRSKSSGGGSPKLTLQQRMEIISRIESGETIRHLSRETGLNRSSLRYIRDSEIKRVRKL